MIGRVAAPTLDPDAFRDLRELALARLGLELAPPARPLLERRLLDRLAALRLARFGDYVHFLRFDPGAEPEWVELEHLVTVHETYFFREAYQLRSLEADLFPRLAEASREARRLTLWCAGCSTGEEAFTVAMLARESRALAGWDVRVLGTDVSSRCVEHARKGVYAASSLRGEDAARARAWLVDRGDGTFAVPDELRAMCRFSRQNLLAEGHLPLPGSVDAILCRNVLIYLAEEARDRVIRGFWERLRPGGALLLGHSESLLNVSTAFELLHLSEDLVYQKPRDARSP